MQFALKVCILLESSGKFRICQSLSLFLFFSGYSLTETKLSTRSAAWTCVFLISMWLEAIKFHLLLPFPSSRSTHTRKRERQGLLVMTWVAPRRNEIVSCKYKKKTMTSCKKGKFDRFNSDNWSARTARLDLPAVETKHYVIEFLQKTFTARTFSKQTGWWIKITRKSSEAYDENCLRRFATSIDHKSETVSVKFVNYKRFSTRVAYQWQDLSLDRKLVLWEILSIYRPRRHSATWTPFSPTKERRPRNSISIRCHPILSRRPAL